MMQNTLTKRLEALEKQVAELAARVSALGVQPDWRRAVGMFAGDQYMKRIFEEGRKIREADRERSQNKRKKKQVQGRS